MFSVCLSYFYHTIDSVPSLNPLNMPLKCVFLSRSFTNSFSEELLNLTFRTGCVYSCQVSRAMLIRVAKQQLSKLGNLPGNISTLLLMNRNDSSWCSLLDEEDLKVLEYQGDMKNYYKHSYGNKLAYEIICPLLSDITQNLRDFTTNNSEFRGVFRFTSSGTVISLLTMLSKYHTFAGRQLPTELVFTPSNLD